MNFISLAQKRYSVRKFSSKSIEKEKLDLILKAGHLAPTAVNFQPQRILVINDTIELAKLKECTRFHFDAPVAMLICYDKSVCWKRKFDGKGSGEIDASIVTTHMMLEAEEVGIGTTWVMYFDPEKIRETYNIPSNFEPIALLVMGYPADDAEPDMLHNKYADINTTVFFNKFPAGN